MKKIEQISRIENFENEKSRTKNLVKEKQKT